MEPFETRENPAPERREEHAAPSERANPYRIVISFVIGVALGLGGGWLWFSKDAGAPPQGIPGQGDAAERPGAVSGTILAGEHAIYVRDQAPGFSVAVEMAVFAKDGWVAVHEDAEGAPGNILGAGRFPAGEHSGEVELLRATVPGGNYYAMLHEDDGDGVFDFSKDMPVRDTAGNIVQMQFTAI